jgi:hypothetical protein
MPDSVTIEPYFGVEARLMRVESGISDLKELLCAALKGVSQLFSAGSYPLKFIVPSHPPYPTPPSAQHERSVADKCVGGDIPIGALTSPLVTPSSFDDAVQEEVGRQLFGLRKEIDEFEQLYLFNSKLSLHRFGHSNASTFTTRHLKTGQTNATYCDVILRFR